MKRIQATLRSIDDDALKARGPCAQDYDTIIDHPCEVEDEEGVRFIADVLLDADALELISTLQEITYVKDYRTEGLYTQSRIFGFRPREPLRKDFCAACSLAHDDPRANATLVRSARIADAFYRETAPEWYAKHATLVSAVRPEWRLGNSVFTSGIVNKNNPLGYHKDSGNFSGSMNVMMVLPNDVDGGLLSIPAWRLAFRFDRPMIMCFDAQSVLHGVTPIKRRTPRSYRYSIVFYSLKMMKNCGTRDEELQRIRRIKTERELRRAKSAKS